MNSLIAANISCLRQGIELLGRLDPSLYDKKCPEVFDSSIGGHFRHNIDHYMAFMESFSGGEIDYDARERDPEVETEPVVASSKQEQLAGWFESLQGADLDRSLRIRMDDGGDSTWSKTTLRRELQFLLSHTIHHYALVVSIATRFGYHDFPENFGIAPSTIHYHAVQGA